MDEEGNESTTQLADNQPQIDTPIRILIPSGTNAPARTNTSCRDDFIRTNAFSPAAFTVAIAANNTNLGPNTRLPSLNTTLKGSDTDAKIMTAIHDYTVLAFSSHRAGKREVEGSAYISLAVIHDNLGNLKAGIENYKNYLNICKEINDTTGEGAACNCLGVNFMILACPSSDAGFLNGFQKSKQSVEYIDHAITYHEQHLNVSDSGGQFVAHINLGLCYGVKGDYATAAKHNQSALRIAIRMQTLYGQSISVGNLGMLATLKADYKTSRTCFEQHLQLVQSLHDVEGEINAWKMLAKLSTLQDKFEDALELLDNAQRIASKHEFFNELRSILCLMGIARASADFNRYSAELVEKSLAEGMS